MQISHSIDLPSIFGQSVRYLSIQIACLPVSQISSHKLGPYDCRLTVFEQSVSQRAMIDNHTVLGFPNNQSCSENILQQSVSHWVSKTNIPIEGFRAISKSVRMFLYSQSNHEPITHSHRLGVSEQSFYEWECSLTVSQSVSEPVRQPVWRFLSIQQVTPHLSVTQSYQGIRLDCFCTMLIIPPEGSLTVSQSVSQTGRQTYHLRVSEQSASFRQVTHHELVHLLSDYPFSKSRRSVNQCCWCALRLSAK